MPPSPAREINNNSNPNIENDSMAIQEQKNARYIKYLKEQNLLLKQQLDKERQNAKLSLKQARSQKADNLNQIQVNQLQIQLTALQEEFSKYQTENEGQVADRLDQIEKLLKEKQQLLSDKERLSDQNKDLLAQLKQRQPDIDKQKLIAENQRLKRELQNAKSENENLQMKISELQNKLKPKETVKIEAVQETKKKSPRGRSPTRTSTKKEAKSSRGNSVPKKTSTVKQGRQTPLRSTTPTPAPADQLGQSALIDLQAKIALLSQQLKEKSDILDDINFKYNDARKTAEKLRAENAELLDKINKYVSETNICNATIIRQKNDLDAKDKQIEHLQLKQNKFKKAFKVVSSIRQANFTLSERNRELEQKLFETQNAQTLPATSPQPLFSTTPDNFTQKSKEDTMVVSRLADRIETLIQQYQIDSQTKSQQIDELGRKITQLGANQRNLSQTVGQIQNQIVDTNLKDFEEGTDLNYSLSD